MGLFSFLRKNKQESASTEGEYFSRSEEESNAMRGRGKRKQGGEALDPVLPEKKRARRRLVGAIALVLAAIIGLPMILDSDPKPLADDIAIQIPSRDKSIQVRPPVVPGESASASIDGKEQSAAAPVASAPSAGAASASLPARLGAASLAASIAATERSLDVAKSSDVAKPAAADKDGPKASSETRNDSKKVSKPASTPAPGTEPRATGEAAANADEAARAIAVLEAKENSAKTEAKANPAKPVAEQKTGKFVVQVAALAKLDRVNALRAQLKAAGIESYTLTVATKSGETTRIRVGPFANKEGADVMRAKLIKMGLTGTLIPGAR
jgi:DedD protein